MLTVGDLELDPASRSVTCAGEPVTLTAREYALLEYLMRRPDRVVSKIELLDHVWDAAADTAPNVVEVYVGYLRRKLGRDRLETVRGAGYRPGRRLAVMRWWHGRSLRARLVIIGTCGLAAGFLVGGVVLFAVLGLALQRIGGRGGRGAPPTTWRPSPPPGELPDPVPVAGGQLVQVVDAEGRVRSASVGADRLVSAAAARPSWPAARKGKTSTSTGPGPRSRGRSGWSRVPVGDDTVVVGRPGGRGVPQHGCAARAPARGLSRCWCIALGVLGWRVVGAVLRPVEQLRAGAESITGSRRERPAAGARVPRTRSSGWPSP